MHAEGVPDNDYLKINTAFLKLAQIIIKIVLAHYWLFNFKYILIFEICYYFHEKCFDRGLGNARPFLPPVAYSGSESSDLAGTVKHIVI